jgi:hypothetical protein
MYGMWGKKEMKMKTATYGEPSTAKVISAWGTRSSSGTTKYETQLHSDGMMTCNCPGWCMKKKDKHTGEPLPRVCGHIKDHLYGAHDIMAGRSAPEYIDEDGQRLTSIGVTVRNTKIPPAHKREGRHIVLE